MVKIANLQVTSSKFSASEENLQLTHGKYSKLISCQFEFWGHRFVSTEAHPYYVSYSKVPVSSNPPCVMEVELKKCCFILDRC